MVIEYYSGYKYILLLKKNPQYNSDINYIELFSFINTYINDKFSTIFAYKISDIELKIIISDRIEYFGHKSIPRRQWPKFKGKKIMIDCALTQEEHERMNLILGIPIIDIVKDITLQKDTEIVDTTILDKYILAEKKYDTTLTIQSFVYDHGWYYVNELDT
jgi:hypothetical protein